MEATTAYKYRIPNVITILVEGGKLNILHSGLLLTPELAREAAKALTVAADKAEETHKPSPAKW